MTQELSIQQKRIQRFRLIFGLAAFVFALLIAGIVVLADRGELYQHVQFFVSFKHADKLWHFILMGTMSLLVNLALMARRVRLGVFSILVGSAIVTAVVSAEEMSQGLFENRTMDLYDWLADMAGIVVFGQLAALIVWLMGFRKSAST